MWIYQQSTGKIWNCQGEFVARGYAGGAGGRRPEAVNNADMQKEKGVGPLPRGQYMIGDPVEHSHLGPFALPLTPSPKNDMFGRDGFFMHGDNFHGNNSASDGCIIMPRNIREMAYNSDDRLVVVIS